MTRHWFVLPALLAAIALCAAFAQNANVVTERSATLRNVQASTGIPGSTVPGAPARSRTTTHPNRQEPCWEVAGVSKAAIQQRQAFARQARQQVEAVCANASLSPTQKREQIREIRQREHQQVEAVITPQQQEAIRSCQQSRGTHVGGGGGGGHMGHNGPCGTIPGFEEHENETPPDKD